jgi:glycopeptide antibiotics resistance protein
MKFVSILYSFLSKHSYLLPVGVVTLTITLLALTLLPSDFIGESKLWSYDKIGHMVLFASWSLSVGLYYQISRSTPIKPWMIFATGALFGLLIEILQYTLPINRQGDPIDFLFDLVGCLIAVWILNILQPEDAESESAATTST